MTPRKSVYNLYSFDGDYDDLGLFTSLTKAKRKAVDLFGPSPIAWQGTRIGGLMCVFPVGDEHAGTDLYISQREIN